MPSFSMNDLKVYGCDIAETLEPSLPYTESIAWSYWKIKIAYFISEKFDNIKFKQYIGGIWL